MRIAIAADHNGISLKATLVARLTELGHLLDDRGAFDADQVVDYPMLCADLCARVLDGSAERGIVVGGSGSGEHMACNKIRGIRAGLGLEPFTARISRAHNNANVLIIGAKVIEPGPAVEIVEEWLVSAF